MTTGRELTDEEWAQIESLRPKRPLTAPEIDFYRDEVAPWHLNRKETEEERTKARERRRPYYTIAFGAIGALAAISGVVFSLLHMR